jgi:hypothetical protein
MVLLFEFVVVDTAVSVPADVNDDDDGLVGTCAVVFGAYLMIIMDPHHHFHSCYFILATIVNRDY